jgi:hypothetical protein
MNKVAILACAVFTIVVILAVPVLADSAYPGPGVGNGAYPSPDETVTGDTFPTDWPNHTEIPIYVMRTMTAQAGDTSIIDAVTEVAPIAMPEPTRASHHHNAEPTATPRAVKAIYAALREMHP